MATQTGAAVKTIQELTTAAKIEGESISKVETAMTALTRRVIEAREGSKSAQKAFADLGLDPTKFKTSEEAINKTIEAFEKMPEGMKKSQAAAAMFGTRLGASMNEVIGSIEEARKVMRDFGTELTTEQISAMDEYKKSVNILGIAFESFGQHLAVEMVPLLKALITEITNFVREAGGMENVAKGVVEVLRNVAGFGMKAVAMFIALGKSLGIVAAAMSEMKWYDFLIPANAAVKAAGKIKEAFARFGPEVSEELEKAFASANRIMEGDFPKAVTTATGATNTLGRAADANAKEIKKLEDQLKRMAQTLQEQVATFGMGEEAVMRYKLSHGEFAKATSASAEASKKLIIQLAAQHEALKLIKAAEERDAAATAKMAEEDEEAYYNKKRAEKAVLDNAKAFEIANNPLAAYNKAVEDNIKMWDTGLVSLEAVQAAMKKAAKTYEDAIDALDPMKKMFDELIRAVEGFGKKFTENLVDLAVEGKLVIGDFAKEINRLVLNMLVSTFITKPIQDWVTESIDILRKGQGPMNDALNSMFGGNKVNAGFGESLLGKMFGGGAAAMGGGGGLADAGGALATFGSGFAGPYAKGGMLPAGFSGIVGDAGPEWIGPTSRNRSITPLDGGGAGGSNVTVINHFHDVGTMPTRSQEQLAARAGDSIQRAVRKNR